MKRKKYNIKIKIYFFLLFISHLFLYSNENSVKKVKNDFLMGSIVKSDNWEIDRVNNIEKFDGKVSFRNKDYKINSEKAIYNHKTKIWDIKENVYCFRNLNNNSYIESYCDWANYYENLGIAKLYSKEKNKIKVIYHLSDGRKLNCLSYQVIADNNLGTINFDGEFTLYSSSATIIGDRGIYEHKKDEFTIMGHTPFAIGMDENYETYIEGEFIKLNKDTMTIQVYNNVKGLIVSKMGELKLKNEVKR